MISYFDLMEKDIINIKDGEIMGRFDDVEIEQKNGRITAFYIEEPGRFLGFGKSKSLRIKWNEIIKIGMDVIIVNVDDETSNKAIKEILD